MKAPAVGEVGAASGNPADRAKAWKNALPRVLPRFLNIFLWLVFCAMAGTGLLLALRLPPGSAGGHGLTALGMSRHEWGDYHTWLSYAFLALMAAHLLIHWRWFWQVAAKKRGWPLLLGFGLGMAMIAVLTLQPVKRQQSPSAKTEPGLHEKGQGKGDGQGKGGGQHRGWQ